MNKWVKLLLLLFPSALIVGGLIYGGAVLLGSEAEVTVSDLNYPFILIMGGLALGEFNKRRKDLN